MAAEIRPSARLRLFLIPILLSFSLVPSEPIKIFFGRPLHKYIYICACVSTREREIRSAMVRDRGAGNDPLSLSLSVSTREDRIRAFLERITKRHDGDDA